MATFEYDQADWLSEVHEEEDEKEKILSEIESLVKGRRYVEDPSDAPEDSEVQQGPMGGLYYETGESDVEGDESEGEEGDESEGEEERRQRLPSADEVVQEHPEVVSMFQQLNRKFGTRIASAFMRNAADVMANIDPAMVTQVTEIFASESASVSTQAAVDGSYMAKDVMLANPDTLNMKRDDDFEKDVWYKAPDYFKRYYKGQDILFIANKHLHRAKVQEVTNGAVYANHDRVGKIRFVPNGMKKIVGMKDPGKNRTEKSVEDGWVNVPDGEIWKDSDEVLEIKDYYRVWVKSPDGVPEGQNVLYDASGGPAGNQYYYEVPFESSTTIDISEDVDKALKKSMSDRDRDEYPDRDDLVELGVTDSDLKLVKSIQREVKKSKVNKVSTNAVRKVDSAITLLHLYKTLYDEDRYEGMLNQIQKELGRRGIYSFEKVSKARRYVETPDEVPEGYDVQEGERGGIYYETTQGEEADEGDRAEPDWSEPPEEFTEMGEGQEVLIQAGDEEFPGQIAEISDNGQMLYADTQEYGRLRVAAHQDAKEIVAVRGEPDEPITTETSEDTMSVEEAVEAMDVSVMPEKKAEAGAELLTEGNIDAETFAIAADKAGFVRDHRRVAQDAKFSNDELDFDIGYQLGRYRDESQQLEEKFKEEYGENTYGDIVQMANSWQGPMFVPATAGIFQYAASVTGNEQAPTKRENGPFSDEARERRLKAAEQIHDFTTEILRDTFGDTVTIFRGVAPEGGLGLGETEEGDDDKIQQMRDAIENGDDIVKENRTLESWTTSVEYASRYAGDNDGAIFRREVPVEKVLMASHGGQLGSGENEFIVMEDEETTYANEDVILPDVLSEQDMMELQADAIISTARNKESREGEKMSKEAFRVGVEVDNPHWLHDTTDGIDNDDEDDDDGKAKARRYIDNPDEAPAGATVEEGERGGIYYETGQVETQEDDSDDSGGDVETMVQNMPVDDWPEEHTHFSADELRDEIGWVVDNYREDVARNFLSHLKGVRDKASGAAYRMNDHDIVFRPDMDEEAISHEMGHATLASYGFQLSDVGNMAPHYYAREVPDFKFGEPPGETAEAMLQRKDEKDLLNDENREKLEEQLQNTKERYQDLELRREDMHVGIPQDIEIEDIPDGVYDLANAVNNAWEKQIDADNPDEYIIGHAYSATNAHETMAMTHEMLQGGVADPSAMENLYLRQQELLGAYLELFEPGDIQKSMFDNLYNHFGPNQVWDDLPYPEVEEDL